MTKERLETILFGEQAYVYAILDGASVPDLRVQLYKMDPANVCLMRGSLGDDIAAVAPYLVHLRPGSTFTEWVLSNCYGNHWGIFFQTRHSLIEMRKQFRGLLTVFDEEGNPMIFRFYDPRVLVKFLPTCKTDELESFFGNVFRYFAEDPSKENIVSFEMAGGDLKHAELAAE